MMRGFRYAAVLFISVLFAPVTQAQEISSAYTELDTQEDCVVFAGPAEDEPDNWRNLVCAGYKGFPIFLYYSDARESVFYGFPPQSDRAPRWESFAAFNAAGPTVEWRIAKNNVRETPFATIHRWTVATQSGGEIEVLVVEKVGQPGMSDGCSVGYVVATGNENANKKARRIADETVRDFDCSNDPVIEAGSVPGCRALKAMLSFEPVRWPRRSGDGQP